MQAVFRLGALIMTLVMLSGCSGENTETTDVTKQGLEAPMQSNVDFNVYKSPTCGCCGLWVDHINEHGFKTSSHNIDNLTQLKADKGLKPEYRSCHTAVSKEGYVFEGHVPAEFVQQFLAAPPEGALGLSVPGMPVGSPGMEMGDRKDTYQVLQLNLDGSAQVYATVQGNH